MTLILGATPAIAALLAALGSAPASAVSCPSPPSPVSSPATGASASAATLQGSIDPNGCPTTWTFEYGTTASYGSTTAPVSAGSRTSSKPVAARITGLAANTTYHFRIVATNAAGTTAGADETFRTVVNCAPGGPVPSITQSNVTGVMEFAARLNATINPNGCPTSYQFEYGKTTARGRRTPTVRVGSGTSPISASAAIGGLQPNTRYHFRLIAYSGSGKATGPNLTFTTKLGGVVRIAHGPAYLDKPFVAGVRLTCIHGRWGCRGAVKLSWKHRVIGQHRFFLRRGKTRVVLVGLNGLGRTLFRANQSLRVGVDARLRYYEATGSLVLIRRFTVPAG